MDVILGPFIDGDEDVDFLGIDSLDFDVGDLHVRIPIVLVKRFQFLNVVIKLHAAQAPGSGNEAQGIALLSLHLFPQPTGLECLVADEANVPNGRLGALANRVSHGSGPLVLVGRQLILNVYIRESPLLVELDYLLPGLLQNLFVQRSIDLQIDLAPDSSNLHPLVSLNINAGQRHSRLNDYDDFHTVG